MPEEMQSKKVKKDDVIERLDRLEVKVDKLLSDWKTFKITFQQHMLTGR